MNEESAPSRRFFTLRELIALVVVLALGFAFLATYIQRSRQQTQRTLCINNLKQLGLGIQNYHDIRQEICPSYLTDDHTPAALPNGFATWAVLLGPFYERSGVYDLADLRVPIDKEAQLPADHATLRMTMLHFWVCPARRTPPLSSVPFLPGDYGNVSLADATDEVIGGQPLTWDAAMLPSQTLNADPESNYLNASPGSMGARFRSMTTFANVTDGLSNTIFLGEKSVRQDRLADGAAYLKVAALPGYQDGTLLFGRGGNAADLVAPGAMAFWSRRLAPANPGERLLPAKPWREDPNNRFGGWHEGVTLFLMGDGQVKAVSNDTSTLVLQRLGARNDGEKVDLP